MTASDLTQINSFLPGRNESLQTPERASVDVDSRVTTTAIYVIRAVGIALIATGIGCLIVATRVLFPIAFITGGLALLILGFTLNKSENISEIPVPCSSPTLRSPPQTMPSLILDQIPPDDTLSPMRFSDIDSSQTVHCPAPNPLKNRADFLQAGLPAPPLVIGKSDFVSLEMVRHLMADKKNRALGVKYVQGDKITNMEGALHTFVTPAGPIMMSGDYRWLGRVAGRRFQDNLVRPMILSAAIHPDFELDTVIMPIVKLGDQSVEGIHLSEAEMDRQLNSVDRANETSREHYEAQLRGHMVYHLMANHHLPAIDEIDQKDVLTSVKALIALTKQLKEGNVDQMLEAVNGKFVRVHYKYEADYPQIKPSTISMEALLNIYIHQVRNEFKVLNQHLPQGYVYTIAPPSIFTTFINGNANLLNRFQGLAFKYLIAKEPHLFTNLQILAFGHYEDPGMVDLYKDVFKGSNIQVIPSDDLYNASVYTGPKGFALIVHNNSDGFGQNIEFEGESSMDGLMGNVTNAACLLKRDRPDLVSDVM